MNKVTKMALLAMKLGESRAFHIPDSESLNTARVIICLASDSCKKSDGVKRYIGQKDGDIMIVHAVGE